MLLTALIIAALWYVAVYLVLRFRYQPRTGRTRPAPEPDRVVPYLNHLYVSAPTDAEAVELFLRKDLELAGRPQ
jgi:hypothetical protein